MSRIEKAGKLLVQYKLLKGEIFYLPDDDNYNIKIQLPKRKKTYTIRVKTTERPNNAGGKENGIPNISWNIGKISADYIACVNLSKDEVWLFPRNKLLEFAEHKSKDKFYIYTTNLVNTKKRALKCQFEKYLIENVINNFKSGRLI